MSKKWMYKESPIDEVPAYGNKSEIIDFDDGGLQKLASSETYIPEKLASAIRSIQDSPDPNYAYLYDRALGAGEVYGPNNNGDWFGRQELMRKHATFVTDAHLFRHHQNKDPNNKVGDVMVSAYNDRLDTVDLLVKAPLEKVAKDLKKLKEGHVLATSMGARVKHDVCSICGKKAKTRLAYCKHLRSQMLKIYPDGRQVFARNPNPRFVDISIVVIPADPSSAVLRKIAELKDGSEKIADMRKEDVGFKSNNIIPGEDRDTLRPELIGATNGLSRQDALATLHDAKGVLRPDEFQAVLRKDASLINPDVIPFVQMEIVPEKVLSGQSMCKLAFHIEKVAGVPIEKTAKLATADFLDSHEKRAYLIYRRAIGFNNKQFLR